MHYIIGTGGVEKPVYRTHTRNEDGTITFIWEHPSEDIVSYYSLTFVAAEDGIRVIHLNVTSTSITIHSTSIDLNGMLYAVSVCGDESEPVSFEGTQFALV